MKFCDFEHAGNKLVEFVSAPCSIHVHVYRFRTKDWKHDSISIISFFFFFQNIFDRIWNLFIRPIDSALLKIPSALELHAQLRSVTRPRYTLHVAKTKAVLSSISWLIHLGLIITSSLELISNSLAVCSDDFFLWNFQKTLSFSRRKLVFDYELKNKRQVRVERVELSLSLSLVLREVSSLYGLSGSFQCSNRGVFLARFGGKLQFDDHSFETRSSELARWCTIAFIRAFTRHTMQTNTNSHWWTG